LERKSKQDANSNNGHASKYISRIISHFEMIFAIRSFGLISLLLNLNTLVRTSLATIAKNLSSQAQIPNRRAQLRTYRPSYVFIHAGHIVHPGRKPPADPALLVGAGTGAQIMALLVEAGTGAQILCRLAMAAG
jgi:hypothetical protein